VKPSEDAQGKWRQVFEDCELAIRYSTKSRRFVLEVSNLKPVALSDPDSSHGNYQFNGIQENPMLLPQQRQKFKFDLVYDLACYSSKSSAQLKTHFGVNQKLSQSISEEADLQGSEAQSAQSLPNLKGSHPQLNLGSH